MTGALEVSGKTTAKFNNKVGPTKRKKKRSALSPVTLRLTIEEREKLEELAVGMTLSAYIRACVFAEGERKRKRRPKTVVEDKKAAAEALALLGQSRIANNLNQLAHHANIGLYIDDEEAKAEIAEANEHLCAIRTLLMRALGKSSALVGLKEANNAASRSAQTRNLPHDAGLIRKRGQ